MLPRVDCWIGGSFGTKLCFCPILERERENAKLPSLLTRLKKTLNGASALKSFTGQTPSWPLLPQKLCPNWSNKLTPATFVKAEVKRNWRLNQKKTPRCKF